MARTDKTTYDPREAAGILRAIPKRNLGKLIASRGFTKRGLSVHLGKDKSTVGKWVHGTLRMSNADLLLTATELHVSPLYLLDLTTEEWPSDLTASFTDCNLGPTAGRNALAAYLSDVSQDDFHLGQLLDCDEFDRACVVVGGYSFYNNMNGFMSSLWLDLDRVDREHREHDGADLYQWACDRGAVVRKLMHQHFDGWAGDYRDLRELCKDATRFYLGFAEGQPCISLDHVAKAVTDAGRVVKIVEA